MATSYANPGGTGDRTAIITVATDLSIANGPISKLVNGSFADTLYFNIQSVAGLYISFDFGTPKVIDEAKYYQSATAWMGNWKWQGSNNGVDWTDIGSAFNMGGTTTQTQTQLSGNTTAYRYYRLLGVTSTTSSTPYVHEFEFKIDGPPIYTGQGLITLTPQSQTYGSHAYSGQVGVNLVPQSAYSGPKIYVGFGLIRIVPIAATSLFDPGEIDAIPASTGGWAMGGAGVWTSSTPTDTEIPAAAEPTGFYLGGGAAAGEPEVVSTIPEATEIVTEGGFAFCGPGATGNAATTFPASAVIVAEGGFAFGGAGVWGQVAPGDLPSDVLVPTGGYVLGGSGFSLDPGVTPASTVLVGTGGWKLGGIRPDPVEVTYPVSYDRVIESKVAFEMGGEGLPVCTYPESTVIASLGAFLVLGGAGLCTSKMPPTTAIVTGEGGYVLAGATPAEVFEAWCLSGQAFEPSVFSGFNFNSFAVKGGQAYACGDAGIYLLGVDHDAGEPIQSGIRIGPINAGFDGEKRLRSIQFGSGGNGTSVRVRTDDGGEGVFKPDRDSNRVVVSRDIQGREMQIDVMGFEEISQFEMNFLKLARR